MLRAGSLYFALFISFIVTLILASVILLAFYSNRYIDTQIMQDQLYANAVSGITLVLHDTSLLKAGSNKTLYIYENDDSTNYVSVSKTCWGVYHIIRSSVRWKDFEVTKTALAGTDPESGEAVAIYVADKGRHLSFSGTTNITGTCYFPKLGARSVYIEGNGFTGDRLVNGEIKTSKPELPELQHGILNANVLYFRDSIPTADIIMDFEDMSGIDSMNRSFSDSTLLIYSRGPIKLDYISLTGNIRVFSAHSIRITQHVRADNIILYAPSIYFERGFTGSIQAFAQDTLIADENCEFKYPSCLGLINENINGIYLEMKKNSSLAGCIFIFQDYKAMNAPYLKLNEQTVVHGQVYCPGSVELKGKIEGSLYCNSFALRTFSAFYENHLLDAVVNRNALSRYYSGSFLIPGYKQAKSIQWLN